MVSHVDADHIEGIVKLLRNLPPNIVFKEVWLNGWRHLSETPPRRLGGPVGEMLTALLTDGNFRWNTHFGARAVATSTTGALPMYDVAGLRLTVLSPGIAELAKLRPKWKRECEKAGLIPGSERDGRSALEASRKLRPRRLGESLDLNLLAAGEFSPDRALANGSSIALLAEYQDKSVLLSADAFPTVLAASIDRLLQERGVTRPELDAFKVSHHGSEFNTSPELLTKIRCGRYLFSTSGAIFGHPDPSTVARILLAARPNSQLFFNYRSKQNQIWEKPEDQRRLRYTA